MKIAVLGKGRIGGTLGRKWAEAGHEVFFGLRDPSDPEAIDFIASVGHGALGGSLAQAIDFAEIVLVAIPNTAVDELVEQLGSRLNGRLVIDATNRFAAPVINHLEILASGAPHARLGRAFNSLGWENFADPVIDGQQIDHFFCASDGQDRRIIEQLIAEIGLRPVWAGDLENARAVDAIGLLWFTLTVRQGRNRHLAFKMLGA